MGLRTGARPTREGRTAADPRPGGNGGATGRGPIWRRHRPVRPAAGSVRRRPSAKAGLAREGTRFLLRRPRALAALAGWSLLEALHSFVSGYSLARALDDGFLSGRPAAGLAWLAVTAAAVLIGALGTGGVFAAVADLAEPLRDGLVRGVVTRALRTGTPGAGRGEGAEEQEGGTAVVSRLTHQVEIARDSFAGLVMVSRSFLFSVVGVLAGLLTLAPLLLVVVLPPLLLGVGLFAASLRPLARRQQVLLEADENLARELGATFRGLRDVAACGFEDRALRSGAARIDAELRAADGLARWGVTRALALGVGGRLPLVVLLLAAPWLLSRGVTAGALAGALTYQTQVLLPALQSLVHGLGTAGARLAVVVGRLREPPSGVPGQGRGEPDPGSPETRCLPAQPVRAVPGAPAVDVRAVSFSYGASAAPLIDRLSLVVPEGGHLAVVGPSGTGKSTLAALIAGMLEPDAGRVAVAGRPVCGGRAAGERVLIPQEAYVFSGSVRDNLGYLCPLPPSDEELGRAVAALGGEALAARLGGLDGDVEPAALSAGERQLVALVRAYLSPAPLAVLDEATCHLDAAAEARAEDAFARRTVTGAGGARTAGTLVVVAHRISSARRAGRVLVLDGSRADMGTHSELLERSPLYRELAADRDPSTGRSQPSRPL